MRSVSEDNIVVPCGDHRFRIVCLTRSSSCCGLRCPLCNQALNDFSPSSHFQDSALPHECMVDVTSPPTNRGVNSMILHHSVPSPRQFHSSVATVLTLLQSTRRLKTVPGSSESVLQRICVRCSRSVTLPEAPDSAVLACSQQDASPLLVLDRASSSRCGRISVEVNKFLPIPMSVGHSWSTC